MSGFEVLVLGVGNAFSERHYSASFLVNAGGKYTLIECPAFLHKILREACEKSGRKIEVNEIDHVILSHIHGDHSNGLEMYGFWKFIYENKKPTIHTIKEVFDDLWEHKLKGSMGTGFAKGSFDTVKRKFEDFFRKNVLQPNKTNEVNGLDVKIRRTIHPVPTIALKISYKGKSLGYSSDTTFDPKLIGFLKDCDVIFHETGDVTHTRYEDLIGLPKAVKNKMRLIHYSDEIAAKKPEIKPLTEGETIKLL